MRVKLTVHGTLSFLAAFPRFPGSNTEIQLQAAIKSKRELWLVQFRSRERCASVPVLRKTVELLSCASRRFRLETLFVMDATHDWRRDQSIAIQF